MTPQDLLAVSPDFLAKTILHRREMMMQDLPNNLAKRQEERHIAAKLAQDSKQRKDEISSKVNNLKHESEASLESVIELLFQINKICQVESGKVFIENSEIKLISEGQNILQNLEKVSEILIKNESWSGKNIESEETEKELSEIRKQANKLILSGRKANDAKLDLTIENEKINSMWLENESHRRRCESRYTKLKRSNEETESAVEYWSSKIETNFEDLLTDAKRVADGGPSSRYLMKQKTPTRNKGK